MRGLGGGASFLGVGRPGSGALPPPTAFSFGRATRAPYPLAVGAEGAGMGTRHQHQPGRAVLVRDRPMVGLAVLVCAPPHGGACCVYLWPQLQWLGEGECRRANSPGQIFIFDQGARGKHEPLHPVIPRNQECIRCPPRSFREHWGIT